MSLFNELRRRNVFRVGIVYAIVAWLLAQVLELVLDSFGAPTWVMKTVLVLLAAGLPLALLFAWAFEMTPEGIKREKDVDRGQSVTSITGRRLDRIITVVLVLAIAFLLFDRFIGTGRDADYAEMATMEGANEKAPLAATAQPVQADQRKAVAVLPFQNLSAEEENAFFASGVHEDILTYLSRISGLRVNSRTSVQQYAGSQLNMKDIAGQLGARYIVEGSVRRAGNQVRVTAQLIDANTDEHLWAENFDRELTDIFAIQTAIAKEIVAQLQAELSPSDARVLAQQPTDNIEAYDLFLQARAAMQSSENSNVASWDAIDYLERAVSLDHDYAQAWALLGLAHGEAYWFMEDRTEERLAKSKAAIDQALAIDPDLPEALIAKAMYHYRAFYEYPKALEQLLRARDQLPNDSMVYYNLGLVYRRLGEYQKSVDAFMESARLEPGGAQAWGEAMDTARESYQYERARQIERQLPERLLGVPRIASERAMLALLEDGDIEGAKNILADVPDADNHYLLISQYYVALYGRDFETAARIALHPALFDSVALGWGPDEAASALEELGTSDEAVRLRMQAGEILAAEVEKPYAANYGWPHIAYAKHLAATGRGREAVNRCQRAMDILPIERDKIHGYSFLYYCATVKARAGQIEEAIDDIERMLPVYATHRWDLALNPDWDPLRGLRLALARPCAKVRSNHEPVRRTQTQKCLQGRRRLYHRRLADHAGGRYAGAGVAPA